MATQKELQKALKLTTNNTKLVRNEIKKMAAMLVKLQKSIDTCEASSKTLPKLTTAKGAQVCKKIETQTKLQERLLDEFETEAENLHELLEETRETYEALEPIGA